MYNKGTYLDKINKHLMILTLEVRAKNKLGLTDDNKLSEDFFVGLLNIIYDYKLINLNTLEQNYAGIDLGDANNRLCIQVTADNTSEKIQHTLDVAKNHLRHDSYDRLIVLLINFKKKYTVTFVSSFANFDRDADIWDINSILKKIYSINDMIKLQKIVEYLDAWLSTIIKIDPLDITEQDIAIIFDLLATYSEGIAGSQGNNYKKEYELVSRGEDFIEEKNMINKVTQEYFDAEISPSLRYSKRIENFLGDPINKEYQKKYFTTTEQLQAIFTNKNHQYEDLPSFFKEVFSQIIIYENRHSVSPQKLLIILGNMYFNCDIGINPTPSHAQA